MRMKPLLARSDLRPGMLVQNVVSKTIGEVLGGRGGRLRQARWDFVCVAYRDAAGRRRINTWYLWNVRIAR